MKFYLVCDDCGEAFDSIDTALENHSWCNAPEIESRFFIREESEAM